MRKQQRFSWEKNPLPICHFTNQKMWSQWRIQTWSHFITQSQCRRLKNSKHLRRLILHTCTPTSSILLQVDTISRYTSLITILELKLTRTKVKYPLRNCPLRNRPSITLLSIHYVIVLLNVLVFFFVFVLLYVIAHPLRNCLSIT